MIPIKPPVAASTADSVTNCRTMCIFRAPSERRKPISRVRSVTLASMMFMITIPPTTRKTAVRPTADVVAVRSGANGLDDGIHVGEELFDQIRADEAYRRAVLLIGGSQETARCDGEPANIGKVGGHS